MVKKTHLKNDVALLGRPPNQHLVLNYVDYQALRDIFMETNWRKNWAKGQEQAMVSRGRKERKTWEKSLSSWLNLVQMT